MNARLNAGVRLSRVYRFFGRDRETVPEAFPGDVVGVVIPGRMTPASISCTSCSSFPLLRITAICAGVFSSTRCGAS